MTIPEGLSFDELNALYKKERGDNLRALPYEQYFGEMDLSAEQKERRIRTAKEVERFTRYALMSMYYLRDGGYDYGTVSTEMTDSYSSMLEDMAIPLTGFFAAMHVQDTVNEIISATINNPDDAYFFSEDRAMVIAENEANSIWNDSEYQDALMTGKTQKTWVAIIDKVTRDTHREVNGTTIPIDAFFVVGEALMLYPRYDCGYPEEIVNCRCSIVYT